MRERDRKIISTAAPCRPAAFRRRNCCILHAAAAPGRQRCCGLLSESDHNMHVEEDVVEAGEA